MNQDFAINYSNGQSNTSIKLDYIRFMNQRSILATHSDWSLVNMAEKESF